ncbi:cation:proton antiporter [Halostagnicola kamekurae]|uniref:Potassium/proton antiporter membrane subunit, CPA2 family n=1 Tax=Halostagnicola kamekurae TaxID=619731 RepID=A0A1I6Q8P0_9EURY|nr:cation:proton antiporter [Halostagnicola kamekurae]SFS48782.1 potassium/proton antiporter membrane subunit, CPA2 family [Halostagnicola kamekurae]
MATETTLIEIGVLFAAAASAGVLANRLGQSVIPLYILFGMVLNEYVLGSAPVPEFLTPVVGETFPYLAETDFIYLGAELGIVFLLFFLGLEFNLERLLETRNRIGKAGSIDLALNFGVGLVLGWLFFGDLLAAFILAGIVYISSSAIITKSLIDLGWIANDEADAMLGTLVYEDLFIAIYLAVVSALVLGGGSVGDAIGQIGAAMAFIVGLLVLVYFGTEWFQRLLETDSFEFLVLRTLGVLVLVSGAALSLGVSEAVAAFFVGMAFSSTDHVHDLEQLLAPLRDTFAAVFFFWIGLLTDPSVFGGVAGMIVVAALFTTPAKLVSGYLGGRIYDLDERRSIRVGLGMVTRGEFSLIIASTVIAVASSGSGGAIGTGTVDTIYAFSVGYVLLMSILGTTLMQYSDRVEAALVPRLERAAGAEGRPGN